MAENGRIGLLRASILAVVAFEGVLFGQVGFRITTTGPLPPATVGVPYSVTFQTAGAQYPILVWSWQYVIPGLMLKHVYWYDYRHPDSSRHLQVLLKRGSGTYSGKQLR
jgi:hypothetical protein